MTRRGALSAYLEGRRPSGADRAIVVHTDTIGGMVKELKANGRLEIKPIGTHSARFAEGAHVRVFTDDLERIITGQILPLKASGHRYNDDVDVQGVGWEQVEVRMDERVSWWPTCGRSVSTSATSSPSCRTRRSPPAGSSSPATWTTRRESPRCSPPSKRCATPG